MDVKHGWVLTVDQRRSRMSEDLVPQLLGVLADLPVLGLDDDGQVMTSSRPPRWDLAAERTAGDEVQALTSDPATLVAAVWAVCGQGLWWCGVGLGAVRTPLPASTREAAGPAYVAARQGVDAAKRSLDGATALAAQPDPASRRMVRMLDALAHLAGSPTAAEIEVCDLYDRGMSRPQAAERLGISAPAVSKRLTARRWEFLRQTRALAVDLAAEALAAAASEGTDRERGA